MSPSLTRFAGLLLLLGLLLRGVSARAQADLPPLLYVPTDEAVLDPALFATRAAVMSALQAKDEPGVRRWLRGGTSEDDDRLRGQFKLLRQRSSVLSMTPEDLRWQVWRILRSDTATGAVMDVLAHGGKFIRPGRSQFCAPYWKYADAFKMSVATREYNGYEGSSWLVVTPDVAMRSRPSPGAPVVRQLSLEVLQSPYDDPPRSMWGLDATGVFQWVGLGSARGWVERSAIRDLSGNDSDAVCFIRINDTWRVSIIDVGGAL